MARDRGPRNPLWHPYFDNGRPRLIFIARPGADVSLPIRSMIEGIADTRGFPSTHWHQSVSARYIDTPSLRAALQAAGDRVAAESFAIELDRLESARNPKGTFNWTIRSQRKSDGLRTLVDAINMAVMARGLPMGGGHTPHITLHYHANSTLSGAGPIAPIHWRIAAFELVIGGGSPYRYEPLGRWNLLPESPDPIQASLF